MFSKRKWVLILLGLFVMTPGIFAQSLRVPTAQRNFVEPSVDPARELFNGGQSMFDQFRYAPAEKAFREVVEKYPKSSVADKAEYYLIRTLAQVGRNREALNHIDAFRTAFPKSQWNEDVDELRMRLTSEVPAAARAYLIRRVAAPSAAVNAPPSPALSPVPPDEVQNIQIQIGMLQEMLRVLFQTDEPGAMQIVSLRLKTNMADQVVLSNMHMLATTSAQQGLPILIEIAKNSPSPRARQDAIYWISHVPGGQGTTVDTLMGLLPSLKEDTSNAVTFALGQMRTDKAYTALAGIVTDKSRSDKLREQALVALGQNRDPRAISALENITTGDSDLRYRIRALHLLESLLGRR